MYPLTIHIPVGRSINVDVTALDRMLYHPTIGNQHLNDLKDISQETKQKHKRNSTNTHNMAPKIFLYDRYDGRYDKLSTDAA
jgi:hypothetical protein